MKKTAKTCACILLTLLFSLSHHAWSQNKVSLSTGIGIPEAIHIGVLYQIDQFQTGFSVGTMPYSNESIFTLSADVLYHFGGKSQKSTLRPWYGKTGLNYLRDETTARIEKFLYLNTRFGRNFNITSRFGIDVNAGAIFQLSKAVIRKTSPNWYIPINWKVIPSISVSLFYKL